MKTTLLRTTVFALTCIAIGNLGCAEQEQRITLLEQQNAQLRVEKNDMQRQLDEYNADLAQCKRESAAVQTSLEGMKDKIKTAQVALDAANKQLANEREQVEIAKTVTGVRVREINSLKTDLARKANELDKLQKLYATAEARIEALEAEKEVLNNALDKMRAEMKTLDDIAPEDDESTEEPDEK